MRIPKLDQAVLATAIVLVAAGGAVAEDPPGGSADRSPSASRAAAGGPGIPDASLTRRKGPGIDPLQRLYRHNLRGNRAFADGKLDEAMRDYVEAQALAPDDPRVLYNLGNALARQGKVEDALRSLDRAAAGTGDKTLERDARFNRGIVQMGEEDLEGALRSFGRALTLDPTDAEARRNLELVLRRLQEQRRQQQRGGGDRQRRQDEQQQRQPRQGDPEQQQPQQQQPRQQRPDERKDPQREAARRLLKSLENAEKEALRKTLRQKLPDLPDRKEDW